MAAATELRELADDQLLDQLGDACRPISIAIDVLNLSCHYDFLPLFLRLPI